MKAGFIFLFILFSFISYSQDKKDSFKLISGSKTKTIKASHFIHLENLDSTEYVGDFLFLQHNKIYIKPVTFRETTGNYKIFSDTASPVAIDVSSLNRIIKERTTLTSISGGVFWASAITAFVVSPIISIRKDKPFNWNRCLTISGISAGTAIFSVGVFLVFNEQSFYLKPNTGKKRVWTINP